MIVRLLLMVLLIIIPLENDENTMSWSADRKLSWNDFKGPEKADTGAVAVTASGITFGFSVKESNGRIVDFDATVEAHFYPDKSWYIKDKGNAHILAHEQLHFDITELHVRRLRYQISKLRPNSRVKEQLRDLHEKANEDLRAMQHQYDEESMNSIHKLKQMYWNSYVQNELEKFTDFQSL